ncbi:hypothetical protein [Cyclobacterium jeungdonense]|uniref:Uncharacterized protein n=1 Tax=Cyclobacterium jeungdonense TaxID=708087 RepID=A0ABT8C5U0_9BACT|nr:hypothetical protein [Cyclobacterium jeungdonense]MDN3687389.1 hypothetical protein [Cyclobacterium jeungdonense]
MKIIIFYSWQTETDTKYNKNFILTCIEKAVKALNRKPEFKDVEFIIQEGVRGEPGSPGVASKINDERIPNCDIFIADLTVVNQIGWLAKWIQKKFDNKEFRPSQNNNVIKEYGVAYNAVGVEKIIGILNNTYGSPNENPNNIPFDLRHLRFPISYPYSSKTNKEKSQKELLGGLTTAIRDTAIFALQHQKSKYSPLMNWSDWEKTIPITEKFIPNAKADEIKNAVNQVLPDPKLSLRVLGLSGLGKTRMLFEVFRPINGDDNSIILSSRVLYINCNDNPNTDYQAIFSKLNLKNEGRIVILDNCSIETHRLALGFAKRTNNKISFISLDSNPEEIIHNKINGVNYLVINKDDQSSVVDEILKRDFGGLGDENIKTIKEFSQGIPLMAVLLGESVKNGEKFIGKLEDKFLLDKLLGPKGQEVRNRTILKACSIFNYFGFTKELASQVDFISKNKHITSLNGDDVVILNEFNEVCDHYLKRGIFERRGRFIGMRPFPLAMSLAQEWLEPCTPTRLVEVIASIAKLTEPDRKNLSEALSEQMKYLGYNDKAIEIVDRIIGPGSPFDNAEVLNTELGSRLFRSFVEVNPIAVSQNFKRQFFNKPTEELLKIEAGRRNIVWTFEKLCFDKRTFSDSAKVLLQLAIAENETWANNATSQFLHLFNIHLSGTEADLGERWKIIEWLLNKGDRAYYDFAIRAMKIGLNFGHASRTGGAEQQGSRRLVDNNPTWKEIDEYWRNILNKLLEIIKSNNEYSDLASEAIANSTRTMFHIGMGKLILPYLKEISEFKNNDWDSGLKGLKLARKYENHFIPEKQLEEINSLVELLTKTDFSTKYLTLSSSYHLDNDDTYSSEKVIEEMIKLADEFIANNISWKETFPSFYKSQQVFSYHFGKRLSELLKDDKTKINRFIYYSLEVITQIPQDERNFTVLGGFIANSSEETKKEFYSRLFQSFEFSSQLFYFLSIDKTSKEYFDLLFQLIDKKDYDVNSFYAFTYSNALTQLTFEELNSFSEKLFAYGDEGYAVVFDLFADLSYGDEAKKKLLTPIYKKCILKLGFNRRFKHQLDDYKWTEIISFIISDEKEVEFAKFINKSVIDSMTWENSYHLDHYIQRVYEILLKVHFSSIWSDLSDALLSSEDEYITFYGLKHILGSHIGGVGRSVGVLFDGEIDAIFNWCANNKALAPSRLAELTPIFANNNTDYTKWHPIALRLIDEYGDINEVLSNLSSNMGTYSWTGSVVPFLESKKELFKQLTNHKTELVRDWATSYIGFLDKDIVTEKNRDAENFI